MSLRSRIKQFAFTRHIWIEKLNSKEEIERFLERFREKYVSCNLVRVGGDSDGGYLHPDNLDTISYCFSAGVSDISNFEKELSDRFGIKSFMADASVENSPIQDKNFEFIPKFIGIHSKNEFITLSDWMNQTLGENKENIILQMDIEGGEFDVLMYEDSSTLSRFSSMIIEFHNLQKMFEKDFLKMTSAIFEKIYTNFSICHVHPNNCCGIASLDGIDIPRVLEVTFIRNDLVDGLLNNKLVKLPHILDRKNIKTNEDLHMPKIWWEK
tara:strand:- start:98 stop:901 length:804 start_codon:yes stop_codon:yes gene_type:complete